jgi:hypothetical protein
LSPPCPRPCTASREAPITCSVYERWGPGWASARPPSTRFVIRESYHTFACRTRPGLCRPTWWTSSFVVGVAEPSLEASDWPDSDATGPKGLHGSLVPSAGFRRLRDGH